MRKRYDNRLIIKKYPSNLLRKIIEGLVIIYTIVAFVLLFILFKGIMRLLFDCYYIIKSKPSKLLSVFCNLSLFLFL